MKTARRWPRRQQLDLIEHHYRWRRNGTIGRLWSGTAALLPQYNIHSFACLAIPRQGVINCREGGFLKPDEFKRRLASDADMVVIYDGMCIFCASYVRLLHLRAAVGKVELIDARAGDVAKLVAREFGLDLNKGMLVLYKGQYYYGPDAMTVLSMLTGRSGALNRVIAVIFRSRALSRTLYPLLRVGRRAALAVLGRPTISIQEIAQ
jgi:predicted DCC family thiol-disulfide oxidoreductase YuxK